MYYSTSNPIFQIIPAEGSQLRANGWKTLAAFRHQAKKLSYCLIQNERLQGRRYTWHITININKVLTDDEHKQVWKQATKHFRRHFKAIYLREPDTDNHVNYHLILNSEISEGRLRECVETAFHQVNITSSIAPVISSFGLSRYITKADPRYRYKRLLFSTGCTLNKHGTVGAFWHIPPKQIWAECIERERRISATITEHYAITQAAKYLHWCCDGWVSFRRIRRRFAEQYPDNETAISDLACRYETEYLGI